MGGKRHLQQYFSHISWWSVLLLGATGVLYRDQPTTDGNQTYSFNDDRHWPA